MGQSDVDQLITAGVTAIQQCLAASPLAPLAVAFSLAQAIWDATQETKETRCQLIRLTHTVTDYLDLLQNTYHANTLSLTTSGCLGQFENILHNILQFARKQSKSNFLEQLWRRDETSAKVTGYQSEIQHALCFLNISSQVDTVRQIDELNLCRQQDRDDMKHLLLKMSDRFDMLQDRLELGRKNALSIMLSMQKVVGNIQDKMERTYLEMNIKQLQLKTGQTVQPALFTITSFEVERETKIGEGGFAEVWQGTYMGAPAAIKLFTSGLSEELISNEAKIWFSLRHPQVIEMYGASLYEERPFMVMPLYVNGDVLKYLTNHPCTDRVKLAHEIALGCSYLHSRNIVHGDLKAKNILIDDTGCARLADFGLTKMKLHATSRLTSSDKFGGGSPRWMAPERLLEGVLSRSGDIYSYAMTLYEIFTDLVPFGYVPEYSLIDYVTEQKKRPARPTISAGFLGLDDAMWSLIEECWAAEPKSRPLAQNICLRTRELKLAHAKAYPVAASPLTKDREHTSSVESPRHINQLDSEATAVSSLPSYKRLGNLHQSSEIMSSFDTLDTLVDEIQVGQSTSAASSGFPETPKVLRAASNAVSYLRQGMLGQITPLTASNASDSRNPFFQPLTETDDAPSAKAPDRNAVTSVTPPVTPAASSPPLAQGVSSSAARPSSRCSDEEWEESSHDEEGNAEMANKGSFSRLAQTLFSGKVRSVSHRNPTSASKAPLPAARAPSPSSVSQAITLATATSTSTPGPDTSTEINQLLESFQAAWRKRKAFTLDRNVPAFRGRVLGDPAPPPHIAQSPHEAWRQSQSGAERDMEWSELRAQSMEEDRGESVVVFTAVEKVPAEEEVHQNVVQSPMEFLEILSPNVLRRPEASWSRMVSKERTMFEADQMVRSVSAYEGQRPDDLSFGPNVLLSVDVSKSRGDWLHGKLIKDRTEGFFPRTSVIVIDQFIAVKALQSYKGDSPDELSFSEGDLLMIVDRSDDKWWKVEEEGVIFSVPAAYLEELVD